ncbi:MAG: phage holin family protein [Candidatus Paceibacterota bacterium]
MLLIRLLVTALSLLIVSYVVPGFAVSGVFSAVVAALILGLVNLLIRPLLLILTLPINMVSLGLFTFVINALMLLLVAKIVKGFDIASFGTAILAAVILWLVSMVLDALLKPAVAQG